MLAQVYAARHKLRVSQRARHCPLERTPGAMARGKELEIEVRTCYNSSRRGTMHHIHWPTVSVNHHADMHAGVARRWQVICEERHFVAPDIPAAIVWTVAENYSNHHGKSSNQAVADTCSIARLTAAARHWQTISEYHDEQCSSATTAPHCQGKSMTLQARKTWHWPYMQ
jgi:hypothetical protein